MSQPLDHQEVSKKVLFEAGAGEETNCTVSSKYQGKKWMGQTEKWEPQMSNE